MIVTLEFKHLKESSGAVCPLGTLSEKKRDYVGKIPKWRTPSPPSPSLGNPCYQKKKLGLFFILGPQKHFWSSPKNHHFGC